MKRTTIFLTEDQIKRLAKTATHKGINPAQLIRIYINAGLDKEKIMKIAIYARVSTDKQETENQLLQLRDFAAKQGWEIVREYTDHESGSKADRVEFKHMFADAARRKFDMVLFWALDRLSREGVLATLQHLNELESYGVSYRSFTEPYFDSCGAFKDVVLAIMATLAKQERVKRSERTKAGLARVKAAGKALGRPIRINSHQATEIARLRSQGLSYRAVSRQLGISDRSVRRSTAA